MDIYRRRIATKKTVPVSPFKENSKRLKAGFKYTDNNMIEEIQTGRLIAR
jgi:hypothetical protein